MKYILKFDSVGFIFDGKDQRNNALMAIIKGKLVELDYNGEIRNNKTVKISLSELPDDYNKDEE